MARGVERQGCQVATRDVRGRKFVFFDQFRSLPRISDRFRQFSRGRFRSVLGAPTCFRSLPAVFSRENLIVTAARFRSLPAVFSRTASIAAATRYPVLCLRQLRSSATSLLRSSAASLPHFHHAEETNCQEIHWWGSQEKAPSIDTSSPITNTSI